MAIDISNRPDRPIRKYTIQPKRKSGITADLLKLIAIIAMVIDHIAWAFVPFGSVAGQAMHVIGRLTAPIMCFMVAEGYAHTRDPIKYAKRLGLFALISHIPYIYFESGGFPVIHQTSVMFPLFLGLVALIVRDSPKYEIAVKNMMLLIICLVAMIGDWGATAVIWIQVFYSFRHNRKEQMKYFSIVSAVMIVLNIIVNASMGGFWGSLFQLGVFLAVPLLMKYNGVKKGGKAYKWFFYIFYPAHLLVLAVLRYVVFK